VEGRPRQPEASRPEHASSLANVDIDDIDDIVKSLCGEIATDMARDAAKAEQGRGGDETGKGGDGGHRRHHRRDHREDRRERR
jgi:hypothetical protein